MPPYREEPLRTLLAGLLIATATLLTACDVGPDDRQGRGPARVQVFIDGRRASLTDNHGIRQLLSSIPVSTIQLLEVYTGVSRIPAEFVDDACAGIALWTKAY